MDLRAAILRLCTALMLATSGACTKEADTQETRLSRANAYFSADQFDKAEKEYREVLRSTPNNPEALRRLGILYHEQGQLLQAYPLLKRAAELQSDDAEVQLKFGLTLTVARSVRRCAQCRSSGSR